MKIGNLGKLSELGKGSRLGKLGKGKLGKGRLTSSSVSRVSTGVAVRPGGMGPQVISVGAGGATPGAIPEPVMISPVGVQALPELGAERKIQIIQKQKAIQPTGGITSGITSGVSETGVKEGISKSAW